MIINLTEEQLKQIAARSMVCPSHLECGLQDIDEKICNDKHLRLETIEVCTRCWKEAIEKNNEVNNGSTT